MDTQVLLQTIRERGAVLFGTGFVAKLFFDTLAGLELDSFVQGFVVSGSAENAFCGKPVCSLTQYAAYIKTKEQEAAPLLCIAVHASLRESVERVLQENGIEDFVWIYPHYLELAWGPCTSFVVDVPLQRILQRQEEDQAWISVRYAALKEQLSGCSDGPASALYVKAISLFSHPETTKERLVYAAAMARGVAEKGFDRNYPILIDDRYRIIDGLHRLAAAVLAGCKTIPCLIAEEKDRFAQFFTEENRLTAAAQTKAGFTQEERKILQTARKDLLTGVQKENNKPDITVIVPVYNVADYIDQCMETVTGQTLHNIEILLIDDGSADHSLDKCWKWAEKDPRITVFHRENDGVASARNFGVQMARGEYIAFVDPDDWLDPEYLEKLWDAAKEANADFAECDLWRYDNRSGKQIYRSCYGRMGKEYTLPEHMKYGPTATYKAISRKSLWEKYKLSMPKCSFESPAVYSLILALSNRVVNVREALYYYRRFRENSLIEIGYAGKDGKANNRLAIEAMQFLTDEFRRTGLYEKYADILEGVIKYRLNDILAMQFHRKSPGDFRELVQNYRRFLSERFPEGRNEPYITWGGYNLNRILTHMNWLHDPYARFNFSSLVSLLNQNSPDYGQTHKNRYRQMMLEREWLHSYWKILRELKPKYIFIDLIEERFEILQLGGSFVTMSDAFAGATFSFADKEGLTAEDLAKFGQVISRESVRCTELWQQGCRNMVAETRRICPDVRFVIIENYLCESVGNLQGRKPFDNLESIRRMNAILGQYYRYMKQLLPEAPVISPAKDELYFTDEKYEYGAIPSHLNEIENQRIAEKIEEAL